MDEAPYGDSNEMDLPSRIDIFRSIGVDPETNMINEPLFAAIATDAYDQFTSFCNDIYANFDHIRDYQCVFQDDRLEFIINS